MVKCYLLFILIYINTYIRYSYHIGYTCCRVCATFYADAVLTVVCIFQFLSKPRKNKQDGNGWGLLTFREKVNIYMYCSTHV